MNTAALLDLDALVIGGGPAGAACAIRLVKGGARVAIVESTDFSQFRVGEVVASSVRPLLLQLGMDINQQEWSAPCTGVAAAWGGATAARRSSILNPYGRGWWVDRTTFDRTLFDWARSAGVAAFMRCRVVSAERRASSWTFDLPSSSRALTGRAKWIVSATGRRANTALAPARSRHWIDRLVAIGLLDAQKERRPACATGAAIVEATPRGWWYSVRIPDGRIAIYFTDADLLPDGKHHRSVFLLNELGHGPLTEEACQFARGMIARHCWTGFDARSSICRVVMGDGWTAVGDSLMAFDPLCGRGISEAISSGIEVADWLLQHSCRMENDPNILPAWIQRAADRFNQYRNERLSIYRSETRWPNSSFWQRRQQPSYQVPQL